MKITPEDREIIKQRFPKFSKIQACMCNNPEYGISLSPAAKKWLNQVKNGQKQSAAKKVVSVRLDDGEMEKLKSYAASRNLTISDAFRQEVMRWINGR